MTPIRLVTTSLGINRLEYAHSRRLTQLLDGKGVTYSLDDLSLSHLPGIRQIYKAAGKLFPTKRMEGQTDLPLPQLFVNEVYIGGYEEVQSLEDAGILTSLLTGQHCPHVYLHIQGGYVTDSWFAFDYCPLCSPDSTLVLGVTEDYCRDSTQYKLWRELMNSRVRFSVRFTGRSEAHGIEVTRDQLQKYVERGVVREVAQKERCVKCLGRTIMRAVCKPCSASS